MPLFSLTQAGLHFDPPPMRVNACLVPVSRRLGDRTLCILAASAGSMGINAGGRQEGFHCFQVETFPVSSVSNLHKMALRAMTASLGASTRGFAFVPKHAAVRNATPARSSRYAFASGRCAPRPPSPSHTRHSRRSLQARSCRDTARQPQRWPSFDSASLCRIELGLSRS